MRSAITTLMIMMFMLTYVLASNSYAEKKPPNFLFILADDTGWNGLSIPMDPDNPASGSKWFKTPNLAKLAIQGMRFSQAYSPAPTCSPTRHSLLWGRSPSSLQIWGADGITRDIVDAKPDEAIAHMIKKMNPAYLTGHLGKWHVCFSPEELGFDVIDYGKGYDKAIPPKNPQSVDKDKDPKFIFSLSSAANKFLDQAKKTNRPFYLQLWHYANHLKYDARPETIRKYEERMGSATQYHKSAIWAAMNEDMDTGIGMVLNKLEELGLRQNTYIIFTGDNGFENKGDFGKPIHDRGFFKAYPQRSHKYTASEGGIRVPFFVAGPGIASNTHSPVPVVGHDIYSTIIDIINGSVSLPNQVEGTSIKEHLFSSGSLPIKRPDPFLVFKYSKPRPPFELTIVEGNYKFIRDVSRDQNFLFNLKTDIGESQNLIESHPERAQRMHKQMNDYFARFNWSEDRIKAEAKKMLAKKAEFKALKKHRNQKARIAKKKS